jgi:Protein of unknown function (DUF3052)
MAGYSGTPLAKKLGIKPGCRLFVADAPRNYAELVAPLPEGVQLTAKLHADTDVVHVFSTRRAKLAEALRSSLAKMKPEGAIWVSWPKKASRMETDITEDTIRQLALPMGLVDIKVCAVDETWSALKLVLRKEKRKPR